MSAPAFMPFYIGDYLADTMHLDRNQHGAYVLLIFAYWRNSGPLVDDDEILAAITKSTKAEWRAMRRVLSPFFNISGNLWHHKRVDAELNKFRNRTDAYSKAGSKGAAKRWQGHSLANGISDPDSEPDEGTPVGVPSKSSAPNGASPRPRTRARASREAGPISKLYEGAMHAADAVTERQERAQSPDREPSGQTARPLLDGR